MALSCLAFGALLLALAAPMLHASELDGCHDQAQCQLCQIVIGGASLSATIQMPTVLLERGLPVVDCVPLQYPSLPRVVPAARAPPGDNLYSLVS